MVSEYKVANDGKKYMMDTIDELLIGEKSIQAFQKSAPSSVFGDYLNLNAAMDTAAFCNLSDNYNFSQTTRTALNKR